MRRTKMLRDDEIEALADRLAGRISEKRLRPLVPDANHALAIGEDERIGRLVHDSSMQSGMFDKPAALLEQSHDARGSFLRCPSVSRDDQVGRTRRLILRLHAGQRGGSPALIEPFRIACAAYFERRI